MKIKTSITLSIELLKAIDLYIGEYKSRSAFLETAARQFIIQLERKKTEQRDLEIINRHADSLNAEAEDVLTYQVPLWDAASCTESGDLHRVIPKSFVCSSLSAARFWLIPDSQQLFVPLFTRLMIAFQPQLPSELTKDWSMIVVFIVMNSSVYLNPCWPTTSANSPPKNFTFLERL